MTIDKLGNKAGVDLLLVSSALSDVYTYFHLYRERRFYYENLVLIVGVFEFSPISGRVRVAL